MMRPLFYLVCLLSILGTTACQSPKQSSTDHTSTTEEVMWRKTFNQKLPLLGHRNWILVVDQAFPMQSAPGIEMIDTQQPLKPVLTELLQALDSASHVKPIIYTDLELNYLDEELCPGVDALRADLNDVLKSHSIQTFLHEDVFKKLDQASKLFQVIVLKTTSNIPYSSVFIELDCGYWTQQAEQALRDKMKWRHAL